MLTFCKVLHYIINFLNSVRKALDITAMTRICCKLDFYIKRVLLKSSCKVPAA